MVNRKLFAFVLGLSLVLMPQAVVAQNVEQLFEQGRVAWEEGTYGEAEKSLRQVLNIEPNNAFAHYNLGVVLYDQKKLEEAISAYQRAIQLDPNYTYAYCNLGKALSDQGKLEEAISAYHQALSLPNQPGLLKTGILSNSHSLTRNNLGYVLQQQGNFEAAIAEYQKAISLDPNFSAPQNNLKEAERLLALRLNPPPPKIEEILPNPEEKPFFPLQRSVVLIITQTTRGTNRGTGWILKREDNKAWIVTNRHVISENEGNKRPSDNIEIELYSLLPPEQRLRLPVRIARITSTTDSLDLAVLEVTNLPEDIQPLTLSSSTITLDANVRIIGHPVTGNPWSMLRGYIAANTPSDNGKDVQIAGADLAFGNSGSPVLYNDRVVALVVDIGDETSAATEENNRVIGGFGFAYPIQTVLQQLREWGVYP